VCGSTKSKKWISAIPDRVSGADLRSAVEFWCSIECRNNDPQYAPYCNGEELNDVINRLKADTSIIPGDFADAVAGNRNMSRDAVLDKLLMAALATDKLLETG
jgi:hypothetical protein